MKLICEFDILCRGKHIRQTGRSADLPLRRSYRWRGFLFLFLQDSGGRSYLLGTTIAEGEFSVRLIVAASLMFGPEA